jgi:acyl dehydratase
VPATLSSSEALSRPFDELREGDVFESPARAVTAADVDLFAELTGDHHPVHVNEEYAAGTAFGQRIAHGLLVLGFAVGQLGFDPERVLALRRANAVFKRPVLLGDEVRVVGKLVRCVPMGEEVGIVSSSWKVVNQDGRTVVAADVELLWSREE